MCGVIEKKKPEKGVAEVKEKLMKWLERVAEDIVKEKADSVAIEITWGNGEPINVEWKLGAGVCECGEWAYHCHACYDSIYEEGVREGKIQGESYW